MSEPRNDGAALPRGAPLSRAARRTAECRALACLCARHYAGLADAYDPAAELGAAG